MKADGDKVQVLQELQLLVASGMALMQALEVLCKAHPRYKLLQQAYKRVENGEHFFKVLALFRPWWAPYPFLGVRVSVHIPAFLGIYCRYLTEKREFYAKLLQRLAYPFMLVLFSIVVLCCMVVFVLPLMGQMGNASQHVLIQHIGVVVAVFVMGILVSVGTLLWVIYRVVSFGVADMLDVLAIGMGQGWHVDILCDQLVFSPRFARVWRAICKDMVVYCSVARALLQHVRIPIALGAALHAYEVSGALTKGVQMLAREHRQVCYGNLYVYIRWLQRGVYVIVVGIIGITLLLLYAPLMGMMDYVGVA
jgi:type II secretory pathway component PulF